MFKKLWALYKKYEEPVNYIIAGGFGTIVNIGTFTLCRALISGLKIGDFDLDLTVSNVIAWVITIVFVYILNKFFVFKTGNKTREESTKEFITFFLARIATLGIEILLLNLFIEVMHANELVSKVIAQVVVILLNYILSKLIIFTKDDKKPKKG